MRTHFEPEEETNWQERKRRKYEQRKLQAASETTCRHCGEDASERFSGPHGPHTLCPTCWHFYNTRHVLPMHRRDLAKQRVLAAQDEPAGFLNDLE